MNHEQIVWLSERYKTRTFKSESEARSEVLDILINLMRGRVEAVDQSRGAEVRALDHLRGRVHGAAAPLRIEGRQDRPDGAPSIPAGLVGGEVGIEFARGLTRHRFGENIRRDADELATRTTAPEAAGAGDLVVGVVPITAAATALLHIPEGREPRLNAAGLGAVIALHDPESDCHVIEGERLASSGLHGVLRIQRPVALVVGYTEPPGEPSPGPCVFFGTPGKQGLASRTDP